VKLFLREFVEILLFIFANVVLIFKESILKRVNKKVFLLKIDLIKHENTKRF